MRRQQVSSCNPSGVGSVMYFSLFQEISAYGAGSVMWGDFFN